MAQELKISIPQEANSHFSGGPPEWLAFIVTEGQIKTGNNQMQAPQIPKVPRLLRQVQSNQKCYDPSLVSIGPYHHGKPELRDMEKLKVTFTRKFVDDSGICIEDFYCKVAEVAIGARRCYAEDSTDEFDDEKFTQIMFLDGCFILQFIVFLLRRPVDLKMPGHQVVLVKRDLLLLENQLPFQVIWSLMNLRETEDHQPVHLLGLLHTDHINKEACSHCSTRSSDWYSYRSAKDLRTVGIRFRPNWTNAYSDVEFKSSVRGSRLILPPVTIEESFKSVLLNLIAYETCCDASGELWVTSYACFLDSLIQDVEDVKVLQSEGVFSIFVREQEVADLFNQMSRNLVPNPYAYSDVKRLIELDHKSMIKKWVAEWLHDYFSSPWSFIALVAATFTIVLTVIQSYVAIFPLNNNGNCG
ncbi:hypothetical protein Peur_033242 [Populus x canadensis]